MVVWPSDMAHRRVPCNSAPTAAGVPDLCHHGYNNKRVVKRMDRFSFGFGKDHAVGYNKYVYDDYMFPHWPPLPLPS